LPAQEKTLQKPCLPTQVPFPVSSSLIHLLSGVEAWANRSDFYFIFLLFLGPLDMVYTWGENERGVDKRLNQIQGKSAGFNANIQVLEEHKVRPFKENKHTDHVSVAFMARAPHKFTENLFAQSEVVQEQTLKTMATWLLSHPKNKVSQVDSPDAILVLTQLVSSPNDVVRERTTQVLALLATVHQGVEGMLAVGTIPELLKVIGTHLPPSLLLSLFCSSFWSTFLHPSPSLAPPPLSLSRTPLLLFPPAPAGGGGV
jgi:hypothetical protein